MSGERSGPRETTKASAGARTVHSSEADKSRDDSTLRNVDETAMLDSTEEPQSKRVRRALMPGDRFGRYRIRKILGEGAMGSVYLALDTHLDRKVALKIPKVDSNADSKFIVRFLREARAAATLSHPNICPVYDVGEIDGTHFIAMAYIQGQSLSEFINPDKPQSDRSVAVVIRKVALALHEAHTHGLIHRDVKPANVMIDHRNEPIIMDFGLARQVNDKDEARLTKEGAILGSPAYMSPEQVEGFADQMGPSCDIYSLGVILFELLTGKLPFEGTIASIIAQIVTKPVDDPRRVREDISPKLAKICTKAMAKRVEDRQPSMKAFAAELTEYLRSPEAKKSQSGSAKGGQQSTQDEALQQTARPLTVTCSCGQRLVAKRDLAGKKVKCPRCGELNTMPKGEAAPATQSDVSCEACGQKFKASRALAGKIVKCTTCGQPLAVPKPGASATTHNQKAIECSCGKQFLAKPELAGRRVRCPDCGGVLEIPR